MSEIKRQSQIIGVWPRYFHIYTPNQVMEFYIFDHVTPDGKLYWFELKNLDKKDKEVAILIWETCKKFINFQLDNYSKLYNNLKVREKYFTYLVIAKYEGSAWFPNFEKLYSSYPNLRENYSDCSIRKANFPENIKEVKKNKTLEDLDDEHKELQKKRNNLPFAGLSYSGLDFIYRVPNFLKIKKYDKQSKIIWDKKIQVAEKVLSKEYVKKIHWDLICPIHNTHIPPKLYIDYLICNYGKRGLIPFLDQQDIRIRKNLGMNTESYSVAGNILKPKEAIPVLKERKKIAEQLLKKFKKMR